MLPGERLGGGGNRHSSAIEPQGAGLSAGYGSAQGAAPWALQQGIATPTPGSTPSASGVATPGLAAQGQESSWGAVSMPSQSMGTWTESWPPTLNSTNAAAAAAASVAATAAAPAPMPAASVAVPGTAPAVHNQLNTAPSLVGHQPSWDAQKAAGPSPGVSPPPPHRRPPSGTGAGVDGNPGMPPEMGMWPDGISRSTSATSDTNSGVSPPAPVISLSTPLPNAQPEHLLHSMNKASSYPTGASSNNDMLLNVPGTAPAPAHPGGAQPPDAQARREQLAQLKNLLKLDVNMGFINDGKNDSPNMLQPVFHWKKRRSISDVGPRTPSLIGLSPTEPPPSGGAGDDFVSLLDGSDARPAHSHHASCSHSDSGLNMESLNIKVEDESQSSMSQSQSADGGVSEPASILSTDVPLLSVPDSTPLDSDMASVTLDPSLIQQPKMLLRSPMSDSGAGAGTGPVRHRRNNSSRASSPYQTPQRGHTPESETSPSGSNAALLDQAQTAAARMQHWRFPLSKPLSPTSNALHPMDAYERGAEPGAMPDPELRRAASHRARHMRAAVSEDLQSMQRAPSGTGAWDATGGMPMDLSFMGMFAPTWPPPPPPQQQQQQQQAQPVMPPSQGHPLQSAASSPALSVSTGEAYTPSPRARTSPQPSTDNAGKGVHCAAQTHTPIVTTSAAQAASASRRKAEALFTCPFPDCGSTFTRQYNLRGHMRSHMDQRPFKCDWPGCGRSFARTHDCKRHQNLHLNIKPYSCESCGKTFARLDALNRHYKSEAGTCGLHASEAAAEAERKSKRSSSSGDTGS